MRIRTETSVRKAPPMVPAHIRGCNREGRGGGVRVLVNLDLGVRMPDIIEERMTGKYVGMCSLSRILSWSLSSDSESFVGDV
jgi:hypothetical protein